MKFLHTCVRVKDLEASLTFYQEAFDFQEVRRLDFPAQGFTIAYLALKGHDDYELELTYNYNHDAYDIGDGYGHIAIGVDDLDACHRKHQEAGYTMTTISGLPNGPKMYYFITDPDGYKVEVIDSQKFFN